MSDMENNNSNSLYTTWANNGVFPPNTHEPMDSVINNQEEQLKPKYYEVVIINRKTGSKISCDFIDIINALGFSFSLGNAFKYFRIKGDKQKRINDLNKSKECIQAEIDSLTLEQ